MRYILSFLLFMCIILSGCCVSTQRKTVHQQKEATVETEISANKEPKDPYGKYTLETADVEVWFQDDNFEYFDRDRKVVKNYETIDTDSH